MANRSIQAEMLDEQKRTNLLLGQLLLVTCAGLKPHAAGIARATIETLKKEGAGL